ncbi:MAG: methyl-accepting chemotaxis protein [Clostridia bacterium]|nr:methyl-accepting chemotaxis protein [Clostridia bacterium]
MFDEKNNPEDFVDLDDYEEMDENLLNEETHGDDDEVKVGIPEALKADFDTATDTSNKEKVKKVKVKKEKVKKEKVKREKTGEKKFSLKGLFTKNQEDKGEKLGLGIHSLKTQVIFMLAMAVLLPIIIISIVIFTTISKNNRSDIDDSASVFVLQANEMINEKIKSFMAGLDPVLKDIDYAPTKYGELGENYREILTRYKNSSDYIYEAYVITENQFKHSSSGVSLPLKDEVKDEAWFQEAWEKSLYVGDPVLEYNRLIYRVTKKVKNKDEDALFVLELNLTDILTFADDIKVLGEGYAMIAARDGMIIYHPNPDLIGTYLPDSIYGKMTDIRKERVNPALREDGEVAVVDFLQYKWDAESSGERVLTYLQNVDNDWIVMTTFEISEITDKIFPIFKLIFIVVGIVLVIALLAGLKFANRITKPIGQLISIMKKVEDGDLSAEFNTNAKSEVKILGDSFNVMVHHLRSIISNMKSTFTSVEEFAETLTLAVEQTTIASNEISKSMISVAEGAETQAENTNDSVRMINDMDAKILAVNNSSLEIKNSSGDAIELSAQGMERVSELKEISEENLEKANHVLQEMDTLSGRVNKISNIINLINDISRQTNLLALNASIEAARAGEHGRGFAVVANEVSKLADETSKAVHGIGDLLSEILSDADNASKAIDTMQKIAQQQNIQVDESFKIFNSISDWINEIVVKVHTIEQDLQAAVESKDVVASSISTISDLAQDSSAVSEEVSAATEEQLASLEQLDSNTRELNEMVKRVSAEIDSQFKL